ncbi:hypothetical protein GQS40_08040|uniref:EpsG family protein n=1 Tax=Leuconostoc lactis TaxID=1246 RepID=A0A6L7ADX9_LEULA|nr:hypothetical protein [Leuconostoc lactis]
MFVLISIFLAVVLNFFLGQVSEANKLKAELLFKQYLGSASAFFAFSFIAFSDRVPTFHQTSLILSVLWVITIVFRKKISIKYYWAAFWIFAILDVTNTNQVLFGSIGSLFSDNYDLYINPFINKGREIDIILFTFLVYPFFANGATNVLRQGLAISILMIGYLWTLKDLEEPGKFRIISLGFVFFAMSYYYHSFLPLRGIPWHEFYTQHISQREFIFNFILWLIVNIKRLNFLEFQIVTFLIEIFPVYFISKT